MSLTEAIKKAQEIEEMLDKELENEKKYYEEIRTEMERLSFESVVLANRIKMCIQAL